MSDTLDEIGKQVISDDLKVLQTATKAMISAIGAACMYNRQSAVESDGGDVVASDGGNAAVESDRGDGRVDDGRDQSILHIDALKGALQGALKNICDIFRWIYMNAGDILEHLYVAVWVIWGIVLVVGTPYIGVTGAFGLTAWKFIGDMMLIGFGMAVGPSVISI